MLVVLIIFTIVGASLSAAAVTDNSLDINCGPLSLRHLLSSNRAAVSWQSSAMPGTCLWQYRRQHPPDDRSSNWFHTGYAPAPDGKYHWLVVRLPEAILMKGLTAHFELKQYLMSGSHSNGSHHHEQLEQGLVQVWTSPEEVSLGPEHCQAQGTGEAAVDGGGDGRPELWQLCATLQPPSESLTSLGTCSTGPAVLARSLLLRKRGAGSSARHHEVYMSFVDLIVLQAYHVSLSPQVVVKGDPLSVQCMACTVEPAAAENVPVHVQVHQLCLPSGHCLRRHRSAWSTAAAQPEHAGSYRCEFQRARFVSTATVTVLYAPSSLRISYAKSQTWRPTTDNADGNVRHHLEITFASSDANPVPEHWCTAAVVGQDAQTDDGTTVPMARLSMRQVTKAPSGAAVSVWLVVNNVTAVGGSTQQQQQHSNKLIVKCAAKQKYGSQYRSVHATYKEIQLQELGEEAAASTASVASMASIAAWAIALVLLVLLIFTLAAARSHLFRKSDYSSQSSAPPDSTVGATSTTTSGESRPVQYMHRQELPTITIPQEPAAAASSTLASDIYENPDTLDEKTRPERQYDIVAELR